MVHEYNLYFTSGHISNYNSFLHLALSRFLAHVEPVGNAIIIISTLCVCVWVVVVVVSLSLCCNTEYLVGSPVYSREKEGSTWE